MKLLLLHPRQPHTTGNRTCALRMAQGLEAQGWQVDLLEVAEEDGPLIAQAVQNALPDAVLLLHAYRSGKPWLQSGVSEHIPLLVVLTGTDQNEDLLHVQRGPVIQQLFAQAAAIVVRHDEALQELQQRLDPAKADKLQLVPQGVLLGQGSYPLRQRLKLSADELLFLHPAGVRPVKANLELLQMMSSLLQQRPQVHLAFCGPLLDKAYAERFLARVRIQERGHYLGEIPHESMADLFRQSDLILNHSVAEGLSNVLLEASALGRPLLVRDNSGNRAVVENGVNGFIYKNEAEFLPLALRLCDDEKLRTSLGCADLSLSSSAREAGQLDLLLRSSCRPPAMP